MEAKLFGQPLSYHTCHAHGVKHTKGINLHLRKTHETIGFFGRAKLIRRMDGCHELIGGTDDDRAIAREWCSLFAHEIVFAEPNHRELAFSI